MVSYEEMENKMPLAFIDGIESAILELKHELATKPTLKAANRFGRLTRLHKQFVSMGSTLMRNVLVQEQATTSELRLGDYQPGKDAREHHSKLMPEVHDLRTWLTARSFWNAFSSFEEVKNFLEEAARNHAVDVARRIADNETSFSMVYMTKSWIDIKQTSSRLYYLLMRAAQVYYW